MQGGSWTDGAGGAGAKSSRASPDDERRYNAGGWCWRWPTLAWAMPRLPSALVGLTAGFGMGPGVPPPLLSPTSTPCVNLLRWAAKPAPCATLALLAARPARLELNRMISLRAAPSPGQDALVSRLSHTVNNDSRVLKPSCISTAPLRASQPVHAPPI